MTFISDFDIMKVQGEDNFLKIKSNCGKFTIIEGKIKIRYFDQPKRWVRRRCAYLPSGEKHLTTVTDAGGIVY